MEKKRISTDNDKNTVFTNIREILTIEFNKHKEVSIIITESISKNITDELHKEFPSLKIYHASSTSSTLQIICDNSRNCNSFIIYEECLNNIESKYEIHSFMKGYAIALDITVRIVK